MNTGLGVVIYMYLKHFPDYIDSKYISVQCLPPLVKCFCWYAIFGIFNLTQEKKVCPGGPSPCYSQSEVVYAYHVLDL